jgi:hypothetical protein
MRAASSVVGDDEELRPVKVGEQVESSRALKRDGDLVRTTLVRGRRRLVRARRVDVDRQGPERLEDRRKGV